MAQRTDGKVDLTPVHPPAKRMKRSADFDESQQLEAIEEAARHIRMGKAIKQLRLTLDYMRQNNNDLAIKTGGLAANLRHSEDSLQAKNEALANANRSLGDKEGMIQHMQAEGRKLLHENQTIRKQLDEAREKGAACATDLNETREKGAGLVTELEVTLKKLEAMEITTMKEERPPAGVQVLQEHIDKLEVELNRSREERDGARKDLAEVIAAEEEQKKLYENIKQQVNDLRSTQEAEHQRMDAEGIEYAKKCELVTKELQAQITDLESQKAAIGQESALLRFASEEQKTLIECLKTKATLLQARNQELSTRNVGLEGEVMALQEAVDVRESEFELLKEENRELTVKVSDLQREVAWSKEDHTTLHRHCDDLQSQVAQERNAREKETTELHEAKSHLRATSDELHGQVEQSASSLQKHLGQVSDLVALLGSRIDSYRLPSSPSMDEEKIEDYFRILRLFVENLQPAGPSLGLQPMSLDAPLTKHPAARDSQPALVLADSSRSHNLGDAMETDDSEPMGKQVTTTGSSEKAKQKRPVKANGEERDASVEDLKRSMKAALARSHFALKKR